MREEQIGSLSAGQKMKRKVHGPGLNGGFPATLQERCRRRQSSAPRASPSHASLIPDLMAGAPLVEGMPKISF